MVLHLYMLYDILSIMTSLNDCDEIKGRSLPLISCIWLRAGDYDVTDYDDT